MSGGASWMPLRFVLAAAAWSLGLFALFRSAWVEQRLLLPLTELQGAIAAWYSGTPALPVALSLECSGADAIALLLGATLAYPAPWRERLAAASGGLLLVLAVNTTRIATLALAAGSPRLFGILHLYVWPALLVLVSAGYVWAWMLVASPAVTGDPARAGRWGSASRLRRFLGTTVAFLLVSAGLAPWVIESRLVAEVAAWMAGTGGSLLGALGVAATVSGTILSTRGGAFLVTQECVATPLIPVYLAAALTLPRTRVWRALALAAAVPLFAVLGVLRILLVALPPALVDSPVTVVHGFYQLLLGALAVGAVAVWRPGDGTRGAARALRRAVAACGTGLLLGWTLGSTYTRLIAGAIDILRSAGGESALLARPLADGQGALWFLPAYQTVLLVALWVAGRRGVGLRRLILGLGLLAVSQVLLGLVADLALRHGVAVPPLLVRAWAVAGPLAALALLGSGRQRPVRERGASPPGGGSDTAPRPAPA